MAFLTRVGNILGQKADIQISSCFSACTPAIFPVIRSFSTSKLFVGGLSYDTNDSSLKKAFSNYGEVIEARVIVDRETCRSKGFGFVTFSSSEEASCAIGAMNGKDLHGRRIGVHAANERPLRFGGFGDNNDGNNFGGGFPAGRGSASGRDRFHGFRDSDGPRSSGPGDESEEDDFSDEPARGSESEMNHTDEDEDDDDDDDDEVPPRRRR